MSLLEVGDESLLEARGSKTRVRRGSVQRLITEGWLCKSACILYTQYPGHNYCKNVEILCFNMCTFARVQLTPLVTLHVVAKHDK